VFGLGVAGNDILQVGVLHAQVHQQVAHEVVDDVRLVTFPRCVQVQCQARESQPQPLSQKYCPLKISSETWSTAR